MAALGHHSEEARLPILRHQDRSLYFRQHYHRLEIGSSYRHEPRPIAPERLASSAIAPFSEDLTDCLYRDATELVPALRDARIERAINGVFAFTPDGMPLIGEPGGVQGFWIVDGLWITHAAGGACAAAEWILYGKPAWDLRECDVRRFERHAQSQTYVFARSMQAYREVYDIVHPLQPPRVSRPI